MTAFVLLSALCLAVPAGAGEFDFKAPPAPPATTPAPAKKPARARPAVKAAPRKPAPAAAPATASSAAATKPAGTAAVATPPPVAEVPAPVASPAPAPIAGAVADAKPAEASSPAEPLAANVPPAASAPVTTTPVLAASTAPVAPVAAVVPAAAISLPGLPVKGATPAPASVAWTGSMRFRYEARSVLDYRTPGTLKRPATQRLDEAGDVSLMRLRVGANVKFSPLVRGEFVVQDARVMGVEGSPGGAIDNVDLYYAFVDVDSLGGAPLALRVGRQVLEYGEGFVLTGSNWGNPGRAWDGARARWAPKGWQVDGFTSWVMEGRVAGTDRLFSGVDALWKGMPGLEVEGYAFARSFGDTSFTSELGGAKRALRDLTSGARLRWRKGRAEVRAEGATQGGDRAGDRVAARALNARAAYELAHARKPKFAIEAGWASGDADAADGVAGRFDPLFWNNHGAQGALDVFGRANAFCLSGMASVQVTKKLNLQADVHRMRLVEARDAWYDDSGNALRRDATGAAGRDVGAEADLTVRWDPRTGVGLLTGFSHFSPGAFVRNTGGAPRLDWVFAQMTVSF